jgi:hypothetical protein
MKPQIITASSRIGLRGIVGIGPSSLANRAVTPTKRPEERRHLRTMWLSMIDDPRMSDMEMKDASIAEQRRIVSLYPPIWPPVRLCTRSRRKEQIQADWTDTALADRRTCVMQMEDTNIAE